MFNTDIIARLFCATLTFYVPFLAFVVPWSTPARVMSYEGVSAYPLYLLQAVIAAVILLDVAANKLCPYKVCRLRLLAEIRVPTYIAAAFCAIVIPFSASKVFGDDSTGYLYLVIFCGSLALSWCDAFDQRGVERATGL